MEHLVNWTWQATLVVVATASLLGCIRSLNAATRHAIWCVALSALLALGVSAWLPDPPSGGAGVLPPGPEHGGQWVVLPDSPDWIPLAFETLWFIWIGFWLTRLVVELVVLARLKRSLVAVPSARQARLTTWTKVRACGRRTRLASAPGVGSACLLGLRDPVVALPSWMLEGLDDVAIDQIVVHEWAHAQRRDDLTAFGQALIKAVAGWHPAIAWIDRAIRFEREAACDEWVVALTSDRRAYAACLAAVAARRARWSAPVVPALAGCRRSQLVRRIARLLAFPRAAGERVVRWKVLTATVCLVGAAGAIGRVQAVGFEALDMALQARPPSPDVYWSASFDRPAAPVLQPSRLASPGASVRDGRRREIRVTLESIDSGTPEARAAEPDRTMGSSIDDATTLPSGQPVGLARPMPAPGFAVMSLGSQLDVRTQAAQGAWAPALRVSDGTVRMSQGLGRGSRKVAASTGRFFARLGRSVATASSQAVGSPSIDEGQ